MADYGPGRKNQYFVPGEGIAREVITADICKYLDNDATVRPMNYQGREGFMLYAYRNLTSAMIDDLKKDTILWKKEKDSREQRQRTAPHRNAAPGASQQSRKRGYEPSPDIDNLAYIDSKTHERRQVHGPSVPETPSPGLADGYPPGRGPPLPSGYPPQQPSPQHEPVYPGPRAGGFPSSSSSPGYSGGFPAPSDPGYPARPSQEFGNYPPDHGYGGSSFGGQPPMGPPGGRFPPQPPQTAPPGPSRDPRYDYGDHRGDPRSMPHGDPRQLPPERGMDHGRFPPDPRAGYDSRGFQDGRYRR